MSTAVAHEEKISVLESGLMVTCVRSREWVMTTAALCRLAVGALLLIGCVLHVEAQFPAGDYTNTFDIGTNTSDFSGTGSVASWIYWYSIYGNVSMTNDIHMNADLRPNSG